MNKNLKIFLVGLLIVILILGLYTINLIFNTTKEVGNNFVNKIINSKEFKSGLTKIANDIKNKNKVHPTQTQTIDNTKIYTYSSKGKRDPFVRYDANAKNKQGINKSDSPLEQIDISKLKLTAIISSDKNPKAVIEDQNGKGFFVEKGTNIGLQNGIITDILQDKIIITETQVDFTGQKKTRTIEMTLRK